MRERYLRFRVRVTRRSKILFMRIHVYSLLLVLVFRAVLQDPSEFQVVEHRAFDRCLAIHFVHVVVRKSNDTEKLDFYYRATYFPRDFNWYKRKRDFIIY